MRFTITFRLLHSLRRQGILDTHILRFPIAVALRMECSRKGSVNVKMGFSESYFCEGSAKKVNYLRSNSHYLLIASPNNQPPLWHSL